jgi:hypothetical protein
MLRAFADSIERIQIVGFFRSEDENSISNSKKDALELGVKAGFDKQNIEELVKGDLNAWIRKTRRAQKTGVGTSSHRNKWEKKLISLINEKEERILFKLQQVPGGIEKAKTALEHGINSNTDSEAVADALSCLGIQARALHTEQINHMRERLLKEELPSVPDGLEGVMTSGLVRYYEDFEPRDAKNFISELSVNVLEHLEQLSLAISSRPQSSVLPGTFYELLHAFSVFSRSRNIRYRLIAVAQKVMKSISSWQEPSGEWRIAELKRLESPQPNTRLTALCVNFLLRYGQDGEHRTAITNAVRWLLDKSNSDGGWRERSNKAEPDVLTTILVLDSLRRASVPSDHHRIIKGENALLSYQHTTGHSLIKGVWAEHGTALAIEYLRAKSERGALRNGYLSAKRLIIKSEQLCITGGASDAQLAVIAAYHGIEHFLYGMMLLDQLAEFHRTDGKTIGFREAIGEFQRMVRRRNIINEGEGLPYRTQLMQMALERDNFIHQSTQITLSGAEKHIECARRFVQRFDTLILGFPLVD